MTICLSLHDYEKVSVIRRIQNHGMWLRKDATLDLQQKDKIHNRNLKRNIIRNIYLYNFKSIGLI